MKQIAAALMATSFALGGRFFVKKLSSRLLKLEKILVLFSDIGSRIRYTADSLTDIFISLDSSGNYHTLGFVNECKNLLVSGESFLSAWETATKNRNNIWSLKREDVAILQSFGSALGTTDVTGQISNCEIHKKLVEEKLNSAKKDYSLYSKPVGGIGVLAGIATLILSI
ncbi:MAG: stage III sporulation protein AB [Clostridia bacterium]|nr:stage III sporulation protein AB [Clostridia bacterium]